MVRLAPTITTFALPREPFQRLIEANRMDQRISSYETWADVKEYCRHSADPVGRMVLGLLRLDEDAALVGASDDVCTGLQLVNFLQDVPRDLELGRVYLPQEDLRRFGAAELRRANDPLRRCLELEAERARGLLRSGRLFRERVPDGSAARSGCSPAAASRRSTPSNVPTGTSSAAGRGPRGRAWRWRRCERDTGAGLRGGGADHPPPGAQLRLRDHGAAEAQAAGDRRDLRVRTPGRRRRRRSRAAPGREARAPRGATPCAGAGAPGRGRDARRARRRALALSDPRRCAPRADRRRPPGSLDPALRNLRGARGLLQARRRRGRRRVPAGLRRGRLRARRDARDRPPADQHPPRRRRGLESRPRLSAAGRARLVRRHRSGSARGPRHRGLARLRRLPRSARRAYLAEGLRLLDVLDRRSALCVGTFAGLYRETLDRIEASGFDVFSGRPHLSALAKLRIVGQGFLR